MLKYAYPTLVFILTFIKIKIKLIKKNWHSSISMIFFVSDT